MRKFAFEEAHRNHSCLSEEGRAMPLKVWVPVPIKHVVVTALLASAFVMVTSLAVTAGVIQSPYATYSLDAQQQFNGIIVQDLPASGTYRAPSSVTLTSTAPPS